MTCCHYYKTPVIWTREDNAILTVFGTMAPTPPHHSVQQTILRNRFREITSAVTHQCLEKVAGSLCQSHQPYVRNPPNSQRGSKACLALLQGLRALGLLCGGCLSLRKVCEASRSSVGTALVQVSTTVFFAYPH